MSNNSVSTFGSPIDIVGKVIVAGLIAASAITPSVAQRGDAGTKMSGSFQVNPGGLVHPAASARAQGQWIADVERPAERGLRKPQALKSTGKSTRRGAVHGDADSVGFFQMRSGITGSRGGAKLRR